MARHSTLSPTTRVTKRSRSSISLINLAESLNVSANKLLGLKPVKEKTPPKQARLLKRLQQDETLPPADQRAVLKFVDALVASRRRTAYFTRDLVSDRRRDRHH